MFENTARAARIPLLDEPRQLFASELAVDCERFVVSHEFGHAIAGHLDRPPEMRATPAGEIALLSKTWQEEFQADQIGLELLLVSGAIRAEEAGEDLSQIVAPAAPIYLFGLQSTLEPTADSVTKEPDKTTTESAAEHTNVDLLLADHPPPRLRKERIWRQLRGWKLPPEYLALARYCDEWFHVVTPDASYNFREGARRLITQELDEWPPAKALAERERELRRQRDPFARLRAQQTERDRDLFWRYIADALEKPDPDSEAPGQDPGRP